MISAVTKIFDIARLKLESMDIKIDTLTEEQNRYIHDYGEGN